MPTPISPLSLQPKKTANPLAAPTKPTVSPLANAPASPASIGIKPNTTPSTQAPAATTPITPAAPTTPAATTQKPSAAASSYVSSMGGSQGLTEADVRANLAKGGFSNNGTPTTPAASDPKADYLKSLRELNTPSEAETIASKSLADINSNIFGTKFEGQEKANALYDESGGLRGGAQSNAERSGMRTNQELARLAVQQNAAANSLSALTGEREGKLKGAETVTLGSDVYDPITGNKLYTDPKANEAFSLSEGQSRYEYNPKSGKYEQIANAPKTSTASGSSLTEAQLLQFTQNPSLLNSLSPAKKSEVILAMAKAGINVPNSNSDALQAYSLANELSNMNTDALTGAGQFFPSVTNAAAYNKYEQLKAVLSLENRAKLKGSGAISDFESRTLESASSALGRNLSNEQFKAELSKVKGVLGSAAGLSVPVTITDPKTGEAKPGVASREEINSALSQGFTVEYN